MMSTALMGRVEGSRKRRRLALSLMGRVEGSRKRGRLALSLMDRVEGIRKRGRLALPLMDNITTITGLSLGEVVHRSQDLEDWRVVVASIGGEAIQHGVSCRRMSDHISHGTVFCSSIDRLSY
ncbi:hypothetical protein ElyMa_001365800 [Elysia marginata]|uniref:Uncharacterized protein n=1 Tax=Elysia marginata TaxID=1093978 RepID=A0AAV4INT3_9GAST|nr:hypothetical protein ElyMa_001365800 [Elysia marginata]